MTERPGPEAPRPSEAGTSSSEPLPRGIQGLSNFLRLRVQLAAVELNEAREYIGHKIVPLLLILIAAITIYLLVVAAIVSFLGKLLTLLVKNPLFGWEFVALLLAGLHLFLIFKLRKALLNPPKTPLFEYTRAELDSDRQWIQQQSPTRKNSSGN